MRPHFHDLFQAQKSCRELDEKKEYLEPPEPWFWLSPPKKEKEEDDDEEEKDATNLTRGDGGDSDLE